MMPSGIMGQLHRKASPLLNCARARIIEESEMFRSSIGPEVPEAASSMSVDVTDLRAFYARPLGSVTRRLVGRGIDRFWGPLTGLLILGLGYALPYLAAVKPEGERTLAF